jgi:hypothetical protein
LRLAKSAFLYCYCTVNVSGYFSEIEANSFKSWFKVADTIIVYLLECVHFAIIYFTSSLNPISISLSASSSTKTSTSSSENPFVFWI